MYDGQYNEELSHDATRPRPTRHVASFAASIAAHAAIVGLIVCFASPVASLPGDWVLAYLVEGTDRPAGRGGASAGASEAPSIHAESGMLKRTLADATMRSAPARAARQPRRRILEPDSEVAGLT